MKTKTLRVTDEGWNSKTVVWPSGAKKKMKTLVSLPKYLIITGLSPYIGLLLLNKHSMFKNAVLDYSYV